MNAFLSVDLDFWCEEKGETAAKCFFRRLMRRLTMPVLVALHHHHFLPYINAIGGFDTLVNLDYHSDIAEDCASFGSPTEGTWVNYVNFRSNGTYIWRYPHAKCLDPYVGYCHDHINPFEEDCSGWARTRSILGSSGIPWGSIKAVGVSLSLGWLLENPKAVQYPIAALGCYEWIGRWWADKSRDTHKAMENGTGIFQPRLIYPDYVD